MQTHEDARCMLRRHSKRLIATRLHALPLHYLSPALTITTSSAMSSCTAYNPMHNAKKQHQTSELGYFDSRPHPVIFQVLPSFIPLFLQASTGLSSSRPLPSPFAGVSSSSSSSSSSS